MLSLAATLAPDVSPEAAAPRRAPRSLSLFRGEAAPRAALTRALALSRRRPEPVAEEAAPAEETIFQDW